MIWSPAEEVALRKAWEARDKTKPPGFFDEAFAAQTRKTPRAVQCKRGKMGLTVIGRIETPLSPDQPPDEPPPSNIVRFPEGDSDEVEAYIQEERARLRGVAHRLPRGATVLRAPPSRGGQRACLWRLPVRQTLEAGARASAVVVAAGCRPRPACRDAGP